MGKGDDEQGEPFFWVGPLIRLRRPIPAPAWMDEVMAQTAHWVCPRRHGLLITTKDVDRPECAHCGALMELRTDA